MPGMGLEGVAPAPGVSDDPYVSGEIIVTFVDGAGALSKLRAHRESGGAEARPLGRQRDVALVKLAQGVSVEQAVEAYGKRAEVAAAQPNYTYSTQAVPNDTRFGELWGLNNTGQSGGTPDVDIDAPEAWDVETGDSAVVVAVIDTGVDYDHPDLSANMWVNPGEDRKSVV